jgi:hypothetical protein
MAGTAIRLPWPDGLLLLEPCPGQLHECKVCLWPLKLTAQLNNRFPKTTLHLSPVHHK